MRHEASDGPRQKGTPPDKDEGDGGGEGLLAAGAQATYQSIVDRNDDAPELLDVVHPKDLTRAWQACDVCRGSGRVHSADPRRGLTGHSFETCRACRGSGILAVKRNAPPNNGMVTR